MRLEWLGGPWPTWVTGPLVLLVSYGLGSFLTWLGLAIAWRRLRDTNGLDWVERARRSYPARKVIATNLVFVPLAFGGMIASAVAPALGLARMPWACMGSLAGLIAVMVEGQRLESRLCRRSMIMTEQPARGGISLLFLLMLPTLGPFALMVGFIPERWGWVAAVVLVAGAGLTLFHIAGGWILVLVKLGLARPASARVQGVVDRTADKMGVWPRAVFELECPNTNALAWPAPRFVVFAGPIGEVLDDDELTAITAHELGHLNESWAVYLVRVISSFFLVACASAMPLSTSFGALPALAPMMVLMLLIVISQRVGRRMEERSDEIARAHEGEISGTYARALALIYQANLSPAVLKGKRTVHPHLYDRLIAAGVTPDYPRPNPPPGIGLAGLPSWILLAVATWVILTHLPAGAL